MIDEKVFGVCGPVPAGEEDGRLSMGPSFKPGYSNMDGLTEEEKLMFNPLPDGAGVGVAATGGDDEMSAATAADFALLRPVDGGVVVAVLN